MTWRAFIIGLLGVIGLNLLTPVNDYAVGNTFLTGNHFPVGVFFFLLILTLIVNVVLKLVRRTWALRQAELMLVWCMMIVSSTVPASGLMRYWFPTAASAPYLAQRADLTWANNVLPAAPEGILLSKGAHSDAARHFYEGTPSGEPVRVPWVHWWPVIRNWGVFIWLYYLATFFLFGMLRKQWVDKERLSFPLARVPLEFTEGSGAQGLLPELVKRKAFLIGAGLTLVFAFIRVMPVFFGAEQGLQLRVPIHQVFADTAWWPMQVEDGWIFPIGIGFAFLVPGDISLSMWFFYIFSCLELQTATYVGAPLVGGPWGQFMDWQQAGAFIVFAAIMVWTARRHLWAVTCTALKIGKPLDDSDEPISYRLSFFGLVVTMAGLVAWYWHFGMSPLVAIILLGLVFSIVLVHARLTTQAGLFFTQQGWSPLTIMHGLSGGTAFSGAAAVVAQMQHSILIGDAREILSPYAINAMRISAVFEKHRRWFLPVMLISLIVALIAAGYSSLEWVYYNIGGLNIKTSYNVLAFPLSAFNQVQQIITNPSQSAEHHYWALGLGGGLMFALMGLRMAFYWWPIHALGFLVATSWCIRQLWFSFFLGWMAKVSILKFGSGQTLRSARTFFIGVIVAEIAVVGICTFVSLLTGVRFGYIFLSP
jgi:hypothetical protein